jgi:hypothetical protein
MALFALMMNAIKLPSVCNHLNSEVDLIDEPRTQQLKCLSQVLRVCPSLERTQWAKKVKIKRTKGNNAQ